MQWWEEQWWEEWWEQEDLEDQLHQVDQLFLSVLSHPCSLCNLDFPLTLSSLLHLFGPYLLSHQFHLVDLEVPYHP